MAKRPQRNNLDCHTKVQGIANAVADMLSEAIGEQDAALLEMLHKELRTVRELIIRNENPLRSTKKVFERLQSIRKQLAEIEHRSIQKAQSIMMGEAGKLAATVSQYTAQELQQIHDARVNEKNIRRRTLQPVLTDEQITNMLNYKPFVDGKTIGQWFGDLEYKNTNLIFHSVQNGIIKGMTLNSIMQAIRGTKERDFKDGIMETTRKSAELLARTTINATANQSRLEMYEANADVLDGVQWLAALDHRTCIVCGAYDGMIWKPDKMKEVRVPPAHPNCRCVLIPYIDIGKGVDRPAEAENFDMLAKERYKEKYPDKNYDDLSYDYRRKLRYKEIEEYSKSGKKPYKQLSGGATFADYLAGQSEEFQREWLGAGRYKLYKENKLPLEYMVKPDNGFKRTVEDLKEMVSSDNAERDGWSNSFWDKVDSIKGYNSLKEFAVSPEMETAIRKHGFRDVDDFVNQVNEYVKSHDVLYRVNLRDILQQLADEPILKNQFETGTSNAVVDLVGRRQWERVVSGGKSDDMMHRERPIYGYVSDVKRAVGDVGSYGDTAVVFKDSVRDRATFTIGNSSSQQGAFYDDVRAIFNNDRNTKLHGGFMNLAADILKDGKDGHTSFWYLESQIWGSADLRNDVKEIAIGGQDLKHIANNVELGAWKRFKRHMNSAQVDVTHYVFWSKEKIKNNPDAWNKLQAEMKRLGIRLINTAE